MREQCIFWIPDSCIKKLWNQKCSLCVRNFQCNQFWQLQGRQNPHIMYILYIISCIQLQHHMIHFIFTISMRIDITHTIHKCFPQNITYLGQKWIHPFCECLFLNMESLFLQGFNSPSLKLESIFSLRHFDLCVPLVLLCLLHYHFAYTT